MTAAASIRVDLAITPGRRARVTFREIPDPLLPALAVERPAVPTDGTEVEDNTGTVWAVVEVDLSRSSMALTSCGCLVSAASNLVFSNPRACAMQLRRGIAYGLVALVHLARECAPARPR
jgi:hypothetical protein